MQPVLKDFQVLRVCFDIRYRYLVSAKGTLDGKAVYFFRTCPSFRGAEDDSRPGRPLRETIPTGIFLIRANFRITGV